MDRAGLPASRCPHLSSGQTILLQPGRSMGRRAPIRMGSGHSAIIPRYGDCFIMSPQSRKTETIQSKPSPLLYFFGEAAGLGAFGATADPAGAGAGAALASSSSTSKSRVELAPMSGPTDRSP